MNHSDWSKKDLEYIWHPCSQMKDYETLPPIVIERGQGINLYDVDGKRFFCSNFLISPSSQIFRCHFQFSFNGPGTEASFHSFLNV